jgi:hypothetical protein
VGEGDQDEEHLEANRWHSEEVQRHQLAHVVGQERPPRGRRRLAWTDPVLPPTVDLATSIRSFRSSLRMRGDPQAGLDSDILRMRSRSSLAMGGRPGLPRRLGRVQWSRNRLRCQEMTVLGFTKTRAPCQPDHARDSHTQSRRSAGVSRGRRPPS